MTRESQRAEPLLTAYAVLVYVFLFVPIVVLVIFSFNDARRTFVWRGFTTRVVRTPVRERRLIDAVRVTVQIAIVTVIGRPCSGRCWASAWRG